MIPGICRICQDLLGSARSAEIYQDMLGSAKICLDLLGSDMIPGISRICQGLQGSAEN
jgi:hypothetical protein